MGKILTTHLDLPIPIRNYDWEAVRADYDEGDLIGYGKTEKEAVKALLFEESENK